VDGCPLTLREKMIEWDIPDSKGKSIEEHRKMKKIDRCIE